MEPLSNNVEQKKNLGIGMADNILDMTANPQPTKIKIGKQDFSSLKCLYRKITNKMKK